MGPSGKHVGTMWDPCEKLLRDPIGNHVAPMWVPHDQVKKKVKNKFKVIVFICTFYNLSITNYARKTLNLEIKNFLQTVGIEQASRTL